MEHISDLHIRVWGQGEPVLLIHGSNTADPGLTWSKQRELAKRYRLLVPDRRGYGMSRARTAKDLELDVRDIVALAGSGAHLVGLSYGGILALLAAARRPDLVYSLTVIEPPTFDIARGNQAVERLLERLAPLYASAEQLEPEAFIAGFVRALGQEIDEPVRLSSQHRRAIQTTMAEPPPWQVAVPLDALATAAFPKLVVSGDWQPALEVVADLLAQQIGAERAVIQGAGHGVPSVGKPFNDRLEAIVRGTLSERAA
jgi:pimeloyl-ACP methyl ester carboxylesterase